jgi:hypothetical protein
MVCCLQRDRTQFRSHACVIEGAWPTVSAWPGCLQTTALIHKTCHKRTSVFPLPSTNEDNWETLASAAANPVLVHMQNAHSLGITRQHLGCSHKGMIKVPYMQLDQP